jgi:sulfate adenylyltransferase subunit 2
VKSRSAHLRRLEAEAIAILRETAASFRNPVLLYSIGKDSSVMLHLAHEGLRPRAACPSRCCTSPQRLEIPRHAGIPRPPRGRNRARFARPYQRGRPGPRHLARSPGSSVHMQVMKHRGSANRRSTRTASMPRSAARGATREKSRAKERVFSHRAPGHGWEPRGQRPELWGLYNTRIAAGETMRVFPLSNWTEFDVWDYIAAERHPGRAALFRRRPPHPAPRRLHHHASTTSACRSTARRRRSR